ncbi:MAG: ABC transporter substrate-binding protein [Ectothiorhodospiraceae bacterium AqS1]|nr:ABC transporter substrate-binding protein [Ectothiorhodospiraceae bacterium AqS1]
MHQSKIDRRRFLGVSSGALGAAALGSSLAMPAIATVRPIRLGYVSPQTGPLAPFGEADAFVIDSLRKTFEEGLTIEGRRHPIEVIVKDSQSNPNRAAEVANELILADEIDMMLVASTPETTNPVSDQCELNEIPCLSTVAPWQPWFFTRGGNPQEGFAYTYHFFWGLEDIIAVFTEMWSKIPTNKSVGGLFPNDGDGNAWGDKELGFPKPLAAQGYSLVDPGRYQNLNDDFSSYIAEFKAKECEIVTGVMIPPDFTTFWTQAQQQGFSPKIASMGKAILFPVALEALGESGDNLSSELWWSPNHPFASSLTQASAGALAGAYEDSTGKQWTQPIGFVHALFEVAARAFVDAGGPGDPQTLVEALGKMRLDTIVGSVDWTQGPVRNVAKTPLVGGQWRLGGAASKRKYEMVITANETAPEIPLGGEMQVIG